MLGRLMESQSACRITTDMEDGAWTCVVCSTTNTHADECCTECTHYGTIWVRLEPAKAGTEFSEIAKLVESVAVRFLLICAHATSRFAPDRLWEYQP